MAQLQGFPYFEVQFTKDGQVFAPKEVSALLKHITDARPSDVIVISHGWNNDIAEARDLYGRFFSEFRTRLSTPNAYGLSQRSFVIMGVLWPSKKFTDKELIAGGAASAMNAAQEKELKKQLQNLKGFFDSKKADKILDEAIALVPQLEDKKAARKQFADLLRLLALTPEDADKEIASELPKNFHKKDGSDLLSELAKPSMLKQSAKRSGGAAGVGTGGAAGLGSIFGSIKSGAQNLLNLITYYQMKKRAGEVGITGVYNVLAQIRVAMPSIKIHLIGHSFGGRLITAAVFGPDNKPAIQVDSMLLLQAAFSHNGLAVKYDGSHDGFFRRVLAESRVNGSVLITHTANDIAVGIAYPLASRFSGTTAAGIGDASDPFGGMGRNGAQHTPEAIADSLLPTSKTYSLKKGKVHNLIADSFISGHSDVANAATAHAALSAIAAT
jgi:hypothetical protein